MGNFDAEIDLVTLTLVNMKQIIEIACSLILLVDISTISPNVFAQNPVCAYCGIPMSAATRNSDHKTTCRYYSPPTTTTTTPSSSKSTTKSTYDPTSIRPTNVNGVIINSIVSAILAAPDPKKLEAEEKAKALELERIAAENAEKKRIQDEIDIINHNKLMESYKTLPGSKSIGFKTLPTSTEKVTTTIDPELLDGAEEALWEQNIFEKDTESWIEFQKKLLSKRLEQSNKWCSNLTNSLTLKVPPLPYKNFDELQPGDVLLIAPEDTDMLGKGIRWADHLGSGSTESSASHTVTFLKEVNGQKLFMDNLPSTGPTIISEKQFVEKYGQRSMDVAQLSKIGLADPLNDVEAEQLFKAAVKMQSNNLNSGNTNYGLKGEDQIVCSEASWTLIKASDRKISGTDFGIKKNIGINFSPADFYAQKQYFLVTPLNISK